MNPLTNVKNLNLMNERELDMGIAGTSASWHQEYKNSAWIFMGGLPYELTEGDIISVFSQYGEIVHINLIRDHNTGKSKGYGFLCYEDQRSTILAVDNLNGIRLCQRTIRVDHVHTYKLPKDLEKMDADKKRLFLEGCAPKPLPPSESEASEEELLEFKSEKKSKKKKEKKKKKKKKKKRSKSSSSSSSSSDSSSEEEETKSIKKNDRTQAPKHRRSRSRDRDIERPRRRSTSEDRRRQRRHHDQDDRDHSRGRGRDRRSRSRSRDRISSRKRDHRDRR